MINFKAYRKQAQ